MYVCEAGTYDYASVAAGEVCEAVLEVGPVFHGLQVLRVHRTAARFLRGVAWSGVAL